MVLPKPLAVFLGSLLLAVDTTSATSSAADTSITDGAVAMTASSTGRYIVQFSDAGTSKLRRRDGSVDSTSFYTTLKHGGHRARPARSFDSSVFSGVSFDLSGATNTTLSEIMALSEVEKIWPAATYSLPVSSPPTVLTSSAASTGSPLTEVTGAYNITYRTWSAHNDTNVARVQDDGYLGDNIVIGVVDTGIDYTHPAFGGGIGPGYKIIGGYDLVGDNYVAGSTDPVPDSDPMDCIGHGTHVAGIAASADSLIPGVAPNAQLRSYKVFGCSDGSLEDNIVAAFIMAYEDGVDIISASLGSDRGFPDTALAEVATRISNLGVFVSIAAGNAGRSNGPFYTSSGGNGNGASVTVGSIEGQDWVAFATLAQSSSGESRTILYLPAELNQFDIEGTIGAYFPDGARNRTACEYDLPYAPSGDVYVIPRGTCLSQVQDTDLMGKATWVFYILNTSDYTASERELYSDAQPRGEATIVYEDGDWLLSQFEAGYTVNFTFAVDHAAFGVPRTGYVEGRVNDFSSWGPTLDGRMKPEISAPGGSILSTWPVSGGSWAVYSGTSMATPYIAGVAALFFGSRGGRSAMGTSAAAIARNRIVASGRPVYHNDLTDNLANVARQGAGLVDALKVVEYKTTVSPAVLQLNDTDHFVATHSIKITNEDSDSVTYKVTHIAGPTELTKALADAWVNVEPPYLSTAGDQATVSVSADSLTVAPGQTVTLTVTFTEPADTDALTLPVYGGQISLEGSNGETVSAAYMGIKGSIYASDIWEMERGVPLYLSGYGGLVEEGHNYTFEDGSDVPQAYFNLLWSTSEVSFEYVTRDWTPEDWVYPPVAGENNWVGYMRLVPDELYGSVTDFPQLDYPRSASGMYAQPQGAFTNGTKIPDGEYMILGRVLRTFGNPDDLNDWQYKTTPWFRIVRDEAVSSSSISASSTSSVSSASSTSSIVSSTTACPTGNPTETAISLTAYVGNDTVGHSFYQYSNFLAVDLADNQSPELTDWTWVSQGGVDTFHLETVSSGSSVFASVHSNTNSLIYMYTATRIVSPWSYLECSLSDDDTVHCESGDKIYFYICDSSTGLVRHGTEILDGCTALRITLELMPPNPACVSSSVSAAPSASVSTSSVSSTTSASSAFSSSAVSSSSSVSASATSSLVSSGSTDASSSSSSAPPSTESSSSSFSATSSAPSWASNSSSVVSSSSTSTVTPSASSSSTISSVAFSNSSASIPSLSVPSGSASATTVSLSAGSSQNAASSAGSSSTNLASPSTTSSSSTLASTSSSSDLGFTTSTIFSTSKQTITACPSTVTNCPVRSKTTYVTTVVVAISTTVCPITATEGTSENTAMVSLPYGPGSAFSDVDTTVRVSTKKAGSTSPTTTRVTATTTTTVGSGSGSSSGNGPTNGSSSGSSNGNSNSGSPPSASSPASTPSSVVTAGASSLVKSSLISTLAAILLSIVGAI